MSVVHNVKTADSAKNRSTVLIPVIAALVLAGLWLSILPGSGSDAKSLVVYCAHDRIFAEQILNDFSQETGIRVQARYDTEATKSLGLINLIVQERSQPRCDLFWNNELLGMIELQRQGLLERYQGPSWQRMPDRYRDADGYWVGFGARMRVYIVNSHQASATEETLGSLFSLEPSKLAMAKPLFGTTLTHYTVLWHLWGGDRLKRWHRDLRLRGIREVDGNAAVKDIVAQGTCDAGTTDTDDVFVALDDELPVEMLPIRITAEPDDKNRAQGSNVTGSHTICIPNTVAIIKGTKRLKAAQLLADYLASAKAELSLAKSKSRQIPLGPINGQEVPDDVKKLVEWSQDGIDLRSLLPARRECLAWLKTEYLK
jgi:iron(III) transport system substrate-binding protein